MNHGTLFALLGSAFTLVACRPQVDQSQLNTVDGLLVAMEAVDLTLNELDTARYMAASERYDHTKEAFEMRFKDTLEHAIAVGLVEHYELMRKADNMAKDQRAIHVAARKASQRLNDLRADLVSGAMSIPAAKAAIAQEEFLALSMDTLVEKVIHNYQAMQRVLLEGARIDSSLANSGHTYQ